MAMNISSPLSLPLYVICALNYGLAIALAPRVLDPPRRW
jgi:hypothetical protein